MGIMRAGGFVSPVPIIVRLVLINLLNVRAAQEHIISTRVHAPRTALWRIRLLTIIPAPVAPITVSTVPVLTTATNALWAQSS